MPDDKKNQPPVEVDDGNESDIIKSAPIAREVFGLNKPDKSGEQTEDE